MGREKKTFIEWCKIIHEDKDYDKKYDIINLEKIDTKINPYKTLLTLDEYFEIIAELIKKIGKDIKLSDLIIIYGSFLLETSDKETTEKYYNLIINILYENILNILNESKTLEEAYKKIKAEKEKLHKSNIELVKENIDFAKLYRKKKTSSQKYSNKVHKKFFNLKKDLGVKKAVMKLKELFPNDIEVQNIKNPESFNRNNNDYISRHKHLI